MFYVTLGCVSVTACACMLINDMPYVWKNVAIVDSFLLADMCYKLPENDFLCVENVAKGWKSWLIASDKCEMFFNICVCCQSL